jgi:hypothetical protein
LINYSGVDLDGYAESLVGRAILPIAQGRICLSQQDKRRLDPLGTARVLIRAALRLRSADQPPAVGRCIVGAMTVTPLLNALRVTDPRGASPSGSRRTASARRGCTRSTRSPGPPPALGLGLNGLATALLAPAALLAWLR